MNATYTIYMNRLPEMFPFYNAIQLQAPVRPMTADATLSFRGCRSGEKYDFFTIDKDTCSVCQNSYSYPDNEDLSIITCNSCPVGSLTCFGNQVVLKAGTWRWNDLSKTILNCPYLANGCTGGNMSGIASCNRGYIGPMCGICEWGYFPSSDGQRCDICTASSIISTGLIALTSAIIGVVAFLFVALWRYARKNKMSMVDSIFLLAAGGAVEDENHVLSKLERRQKKVRQSWISRFKIFIATYQVIVSTPSTFNINFGPLFTSFVSTAKVVNFDFVSFVPIACFQKFQFVQGMISSSVAPLTIVGTFIIMCAFQYWSIRARETDRMRRRVTMGLVIKRYLIVCIAVMSMVLTSTCSKVFKIFDCFDVDPDRQAGDGLPHRFLRIDTAVDCSSEEYQLGLSWAYLMIIMYPIAVPSVFFYLLWTNKSEIYGRGLRSRSLALIDQTDDMEMGTERNDAWRKAEIMRKKFEKMNQSGGGTVEGLTFIFEQYHPEWCFWEIIEICRRIMLTSIISLLQPGTPFQCTASVLIAVIYLKLYNSCAPFVEENDNFTAEIGQYQVFVTFFGVLVLKQSSFGDPAENPILYGFVDFCLVSINCLMVAMLMSVAWREYMEDKRLRALRVKVCVAAPAAFFASFFPTD